jgi:hypothetical protein
MWVVAYTDERLPGLEKASGLLSHTRLNLRKCSRRIHWRCSGRGVYPCPVFTFVCKEFTASFVCLTTVAY